MKIPVFLSMKAPPRERPVSVALRVLAALIDVERATIAKLVEDTDARSQPAVAYAVKQLLAVGLLEAGEDFESAATGRRSRTYRLSQRLRGTP